MDPKQQQEEGYFTEQEHQRRVEEFGSKLLKSMHTALQKHSSSLAKLQLASLNSAIEKMISLRQRQQELDEQDQQQLKSKNINNEDEDNEEGAMITGVEERGLKMIKNKGSSKFYGEEDHNDSGKVVKQKVDQFAISRMYPALHRKNGKSGSGGGAEDENGGYNDCNEASDSNQLEGSNNNNNNNPLNSSTMASSSPLRNSSSGNVLPRTFSEKKLQSQLDALVGGDTKKKQKELEKLRLAPMAQQRDPHEQHHESTTGDHHHHHHHHDDHHLVNSINDHGVHGNNTANNKTKDFFELPSVKNLRDLRVLAFALRDATTKLSASVNRDKQSTLMRQRLVAAAKRESLSGKVTLVDDMLLVSSARNVLSHLEGNILSFIQKRRKARLLATTMPQNLLDQLGDLMKSTGIARGDNASSPAKRRASITMHKVLLGGSGENSISNNGSVKLNGEEETRPELMVSKPNSNNDNNNNNNNNNNSDGDDQKTHHQQPPKDSSSLILPFSSRKASTVIGDNSSGGIAVVSIVPPINTSQIFSASQTDDPFHSVPADPSQHEYSGLSSLSNVASPQRSALKGAGERKKSRVGFEETVKVFQVKTQAVDDDGNVLEKVSSVNDDDPIVSVDNSGSEQPPLLSTFKSMVSRENSELLPTDAQNTTMRSANNSSTQNDSVSFIGLNEDESSFGDGSVAPTQRRKTLRDSQVPSLGLNNNNRHQGGNNNRRASVADILAAAHSQLEESQRVVKSSKEREEQDRQNELEASLRKVREEEERERNLFLGLIADGRADALRDDPMFILNAVPPPTPEQFNNDDGSSGDNNNNSNNKPTSSPRRASTFATTTTQSPSKITGVQDKRGSIFGIASGSPQKKVDPTEGNVYGTSPRVRRRSNLHEVRGLKKDQQDAANNNKNNDDDHQYVDEGPSLLSEEEEAMIREVMQNSDSGSTEKKLKRQSSAIFQYGVSEREQDLNVINKTGTSLTTLLDKTKDELDTYTGEMNSRDAGLLRQLVQESQNLLHEMEPISQLLQQEQRKRKQFVHAVRMGAVEEYNDITANLLHTQHEAVKLRKQRRDLIRQYLIWRQTKRADAAMTSATFEEHLQTGLTKRTVGTQCSVPASAIPVQLVKTVRMMQEVPNLQRHVNEVRKLVVELNSVDSKSEEALACQVCGGSLHEAILIWPCGDTVCKQCAREAVQEYADQPFKQCPACRMISMTEDFNVSPNNIVRDVSAKWSFKKSGFYDIASASDALQKRLQNYQREEVFRAYEAVQQASTHEGDEEDLVNTEIISQFH